MAAGLEHGRQPELLSLGKTPLGVRDRSQLPRQAKLAKAGQRPVGPGDQRDALGRARHRKRHRQVSAGLLHADAAHHIDEHVGGSQPDAGVANEYRQHQRHAVSIEPRHDAARGHQLRR